MCKSGNLVCLTAAVLNGAGDFEIQYVTNLGVVNNTVRLEDVYVPYKIRSIIQFLNEELHPIQLAQYISTQALYNERVCPFDAERYIVSEMIGSESNGFHNCVINTEGAIGDVKLVTKVMKLLQIRRGHLEG